MPETILDFNKSCDILDNLVKTHTLTPEERAKVDIFSQNRGGVGSRGYGENSLGYEIAWWVHPERYHKEMQFLLSYFSLEGKKNILSIGCGPAFHEIALACAFPNLNILATDLDKREIATAQKIALNAKVSDNITFKSGDALSITSAHSSSKFDQIISFATLHDVPQLELFLESIAQGLSSDGLFLFSYNPFRLQSQFSEIESLERLLDKHFTIKDSVVLTSEKDSLAYYGEIAQISQEKRGYPLVWNGMVVKLK